MQHRKGNRRPDLDHRPRSRCFHCSADVDAVQKFTDPGRRRPMRYRRQYIYACPSCGREAMPYIAPAATAIDWTIPAPLIGERKAPLRPATMARIAAGLERYGWIGAPGLTVPTEHSTRNGQIELKWPRPPGWPLRGQTGRQVEGLLVTNRTNGHAHPPDDPLTTVTTGRNHLLITDRRNGTARDPDQAPSTTFAAGGTHHMLLQPPEHAYVVANYDPGWTRDADAMPAGSFTGRDSHALLVPYDGTARSPGWPLPTQTSIQGDGLLVPAGGSWANRPTDTGEPFPTQTGSECRGLVQLPDGLLVQVGGNTWERPGSACRSRPTSWPMRSQTGTRSEGLVTVPADFLRPFRGATPWAKLDALPEYVIEAINQCGWRMLGWQEIRNGMAFRPDYILHGNVTEKVMQLGQAVTPPVMSWIFARVAASLGGGQS